jgi:para-aminobenzoate synthetase component 1
LPGLRVLESAGPRHDLARYSYLAADPVATVAATSAEWPTVRERLRATINAHRAIDSILPPFQGGWLGWFSYELGAAFDAMPRAERPGMAVPDVALALYDWVIAWDHHRGAAWLISSGVDPVGQCDRARAERRAEDVLARIRRFDNESNAPQQASLATDVSPHGLVADFTPEAYRGAVARVIEHVRDGDIFQATLSQRFTLPFTGDAHRLYAALVERTGAPMSAFMQHGDVTIVSASPERFLRYDAATRAVETRPIKGTRPRGHDALADAALAAELVASAKDRAENVMIVDLMRNDLARVCDAGTVAVPVLCRVESFATVHHLVSVVTGRLSAGYDALDLLAAAFPGGSVTGAPKLRAMAIIAAVEPVTRGVYCGAIGWLGLDGSMDTSIAIRTMIVRDGQIAAHAGGGVTLESTPDGEYQETLDKVRALLAALAAVA